MGKSLQLWLNSCSQGGSLLYVAGVIEQLYLIPYLWDGIARDLERAPPTSLSGNSAPTFSGDRIGRYAFGNLHGKFPGSRCNCEDERDEKGCHGDSSRPDTNDTT